MKSRIEMDQSHTIPLECKEIYLDNNGTTKPLAEVRKEMLKVLGKEFGNPSSIHSSGDRAREYLHKARNNLSLLIGGEPEGLIFTSGGTESNNMVLLSLMDKFNGGKRIITTDIEHSSVKRCCEYLVEKGFEVISVPVNQKGIIEIDSLKGYLTSETALVSVQLVNNETGVIQPVEMVGNMCHERGIPFHSDIAQAVGKMEINAMNLPVDFITFTAHKFHGPQGVGAIYAKEPRWLVPLFHGGDQESKRRAGTENVPGIVGMGKAAELRFNHLRTCQRKLERMRDMFEDLILHVVPDTEINGDLTHRICNTSNLLFRNVDGQALVAQLDHQGIRCSQSSACTSNRPEPSYVLTAMGLTEEEAYSSVRFSFSILNTEKEVRSAAKLIAGTYKRLRRFNLGKKAMVGAGRG